MNVFSQRIAVSNKYKSVWNTGNVIISNLLQEAGRTPPESYIFLLLDPRVFSICDPVLVLVVSGLDTWISTCPLGNSFSLIYLIVRTCFLISRQHFHFCVSYSTFYLYLRGAALTVFFLLCACPSNIYVVSMSLLSYAPSLQTALSSFHLFP